MIKNAVLAIFSITGLLLPSVALPSPVPCDGLVCSVSVGGSSITYNAGSTPGIVDDGSLHKQNTPAALQAGTLTAQITCSPSILSSVWEMLLENQRIRIALFSTQSQQLKMRLPEKFMLFMKAFCPQSKST